MDVKQKQWIDILYPKLDVENVKQNNHQQMNVKIVKYNLHIIIVIFVNYMMMIRKKIFIIVKNVKCVEEVKEKNNFIVINVMFV